MGLEDCIRNFARRIAMPKKLGDIFNYFTRKSAVQEYKKDVPGIYSVPLTESYKKPGINKKLTKETLLKYGGPAHVEAFEKISGIKLDEE